MNTVWPYVGAVLAGLGAILGPLLVFRNTRKQTTTDLAQKFIDQVQEERATDRQMFFTEKQSLEQRLDRAFQRIEGMEARERMLLDYVSALRHHIDTKSDPPPPPFPSGLSSRPAGGDR